MRIVKFPKTMWQNLGKDTAPPFRTSWKLAVTCGMIDKKYPDAPKVSGCNAEVLLGREDVYKQMLASGNGYSCHWLCPCCGSQQVVPVPDLEANFVLPTKEAWLEKRRDGLVKELLLDKEFSAGINYSPALEFLEEVGIDIPDWYLNEKETTRPQPVKIIN